jgi:hypothetical protein
MYGEKSMSATGMVNQSFESDLELSRETTFPPMQHQWPLLGKELFALEHTHTDISGANKQPLTEQEKEEKRADIRNAIVAQLFREEETYTRDTRHLAFLSLKAGRGGAIVGNPSTIVKGDKKQELPYTGLEGYYAGSEMTNERPGLTPEAILQEEADIGAHLLGSIKKQAIEQNSWVTFSGLKHVLDGGEPGLEQLRTIQLLWSMIVRQLHVRIYRNVDFELTLTEQIEQIEQLQHLLSGTPGRTLEDKQVRESLQAECDRLKQELENLSDEDRKKERRERRTREWIRSDRLAEYHRFREETYQMVTTSGQSQYNIGVQDASLEMATIVETITLPRLPGRNAYSPTTAHFTQGQLEGYLFLAKLGAIGGDPLARSDLVSK